MCYYVFTWQGNTLKGLLTDLQALGLKAERTLKRNRLREQEMEVKGHQAGKVPRAPCEVSPECPCGRIDSIPLTKGPPASLNEMNGDG